MQILIRYLSLVIKLVTSIIIWMGLMTSVARASDSGSAFGHVKDSLWTMGVEGPSIDRAMSDDEQQEDASLEAKKELPEELIKALKHM